MKLYCTEIKAINPLNGNMTIWGGPNVPGISFKDAENYCQNNGLGYCKIIGTLVEEIPCKDGTYIPDWNNRVRYDYDLN